MQDDSPWKPPAERGPDGGSSPSTPPPPPMGGHGDAPAGTPAPLPAPLPATPPPASPSSAQTPPPPPGAPSSALPPQPVAPLAAPPSAAVPPTPPMGLTGPSAAPLHAAAPEMPVVEPGIVQPVADQPQRSRWVVVGAFAAVVAVVAAGIFAIVNLTGNSEPGGAASPEELGGQLLAAIDNEDLLGAIDLLLPGERRSLGEPFVDMIGELQRIEVLADTDLSSLNGLDVTLSAQRVTVRPTNVTDIVNIDLGADVAVSVNGGELPVGELITDALPEDMLTEFRGTQLTETDSFDFWLTAVEDDGSWYFSLLHSIAEIGRRDGAPGMNIPTRGLVPVGAESPEAAVDLMLGHIEQLDVRGMITALNPDEAAALQRYAPLFIADAEAALDDAPITWEIVEREIRVEGSGSERTAFVDALSIEGDAEGIEFSFDYSDGCVRGSAEGETFEQCMADNGLGDLDEVLIDSPALVDLIETVEETFDDVEPIGFELREHDGEWFVSPIGTVTVAWLNVMRAVDRDEIEAIVDGAEAAMGDLGALFFGNLGSVLSGEGAFGDSVFADDAFGAPADDASEMFDEPAEAMGDSPAESFDDEPGWFICYDERAADAARACFDGFIASGDINIDVVPIELRFPECGYADLGWSGDVYSLPDDEFIAAVAPASECFLDLVDQGQVQLFELPNELAYLECFEGRNWYQVFDDPEYDERYYACIDERLET